VTARDDIELTPEQAAEGWVIKEQGGMLVKTLDLSKLTPRLLTALDEWKLRALVAESKLARLRDRIARNHVHTSDQLRALLEEP
jgi:hypothetical protein